MKPDEIELWGDGEMASERVRNALRAAIIGTGHTLTDTARYLNTTPKHLSRMLNGHTGLRADWIDRIADACGVRIDIRVTRVK